MLELRKKLSNYQEVFYLLFLLPMTGMSSMGLNSEDRIYLYVFAVATLFLLLKMAVTDFCSTARLRSPTGSASWSWQC